MARKRQKTVVVGAGPVGALAALYAANRGDVVEVYELRGDLRDQTTTPLNFTKSINLALSERGINSLRKANVPGLLESVLKRTIPMYGRMIHGRKLGSLYEQSQAYDAKGRAVLAVDRAGLNAQLLDELETNANVRLMFKHKLTGADFRRNVAWFETHKGIDKVRHEVEVTFDFLIGADGAHSAVRYHLMKFTRMSYQQSYIDTLWCEFTIDKPSDATSVDHDGFALSPNHLHIWPGGSSMFIAIPSLDKTFTCTLFLPASDFDKLDNTEIDLVDFFNTNFPGVVPKLIGAPALREQYRQNPHLPLIDIRCGPYHCGSSAVILGDAAHAMVPFYGQGMNAGLEDVRVLFDLLDAHAAASNASPDDVHIARSAALAAYSNQRMADAVTINELALENYQEMRDGVRRPLYKARKAIEEALSTWLPTLGVRTQYTRVSFENQRYSEVRTAVMLQGRVLSGTMGLIACASLLYVALGWRRILASRFIQVNDAKLVEWFSTWI